MESASDLECSENFPAYVPVEGPRPELLTALIEQIRYERTDGPTLPTRVVTTSSKASKPILAESLIEDTTNSQVEFTYQDFLSMLHKRIRASAPK